MKKWMGLAALALALLMLAGCAAQVKDDAVAQAALDYGPESKPDATAEPAGEVFEIREKLFIAQVNEIYLNADDYMGKTIRYEGVFDMYPYTEAGDMFYSVIRYGPGCCGNDGNVGFEVVWDAPYPEQGAWVRAEGKLERYQEFGETYLRLRVSKLDELATRGNETVTQ